MSNAITPKLSEWKVSINDAKFSVVVVVFGTWLKVSFGLFVVLYSPNLVLLISKSQHYDKSKVLVDLVQNDELGSSIP